MVCSFRQLGIVLVTLRALSSAAATPPSQWTAQCLQDRVDCAVYPTTIHIPSGDYYFHHNNLDISRARNLSIVANGTVTLWFSGDAGVNMTHSTDIQFRGVTIDYDPPPPAQPTFQEKSGITLHLYNCTRIIIQDVTIGAAPFMAVTAFQGGGDHIFRRLHFVPHPHRELVGTRDALHFSDLRKGPTVVDSTIGYTGDDFFNVHSTLLLVLNCKWRTTVGRLQMECLLVNPLVTPDAPRNTVYGTFSTLPFVVPGDMVSFFEWPATDMVMKPLIHGAMAVQELENVSQDYGEMAQRTLPALLEYPGSWHEATNQTTTFSAKEVWKVVLEVPDDSAAYILPAVGTIATIDTIATRGAKIIDNTFVHSHCNLGRFKSPGGVIQGNTFGQARIPNLEISALPQWLEGPVDVRDILVADNVFQGDPVHCGPLCENPDCQYACEQCPTCRKDTAWAKNITLRNNSIEWNTNTMKGMGLQ